MSESTYLHRHTAEGDELSNLTLKNLIDLLDRGGGNIAVAGVEGGGGPALIVAVTGEQVDHLYTFLKQHDVHIGDDTLKGAEA